MFLLNIRAFQSDNGTEYVNVRFQKLFRECGTLHRRSMPSAHQQCGVAERLNQQLLTIARCILIEAGLAARFWGEAISTACYIKNRCVSSTTNNVPIELWLGEGTLEMDLSRMRVFGSRAWACSDNPKGNKMMPRARECLMIGYPKDGRGYKLWDIGGKRMIKSRDVCFQEDVYSMREMGKISKNEIGTESEIVSVGIDPENVDVLVDSEGDSENEIQAEINAKNGQIDNVINVRSDTSEQEGEINFFHDEDDFQNDFVEGYKDVLEQGGDHENVAHAPVLRRSTRLRKEKLPCECCKNISTRCVDHKFCDHKTVKEALRGEHRNEWTKAMNGEMKSLQDNNTWELVKMPPDRKTLGCKWVFAGKRDQDGNIIKFKDRLVA
jgi:hypothetical protein